MEHTDGCTHEGEWVSDEPCGRGLERLSDGSMYEGDFLCGKRRGFGMCDFSDGHHYEDKGKNKFPGTCYHCGKVGHKAAECWFRDGASKGSGKDPSANVTSSGKGKSKGRGKSRRPVNALGFEEELWNETNETEPGKWWDSWDDNVEPDRGGAPLGAIVVGGTELELNSFKTASGEILPDEGQLMWPCFLQGGRKCRLRGHVTGVHKPLI